MHHLDMCGQYTASILCGGSRDVKRQILSTFLIVSILLHTQALQSDEANKDDEKQITITYKAVGNDAELTCTVKDIGSRRVIWSKMSDPYPISVGQTRFTPKKKYKITRKSHNTYVLTIKKLSLEEAGEYQCRVSGGELIAEVISLNIPVALDSTSLIPKETVVPTEVGSTVKLPCHVNHLRSHLVLWKNEKNEVVSLRKKVYSGDTRFKVIHGTKTEWSIEIRGVRDTDFGQYTCIVNSDPVLTRTIILKNTAPVQMAPVLKRDSQYRVRVEADAGDKVTLVCNFKANPPAKVTWYKRVEENNRKTSKEVGTGSSLTFQSTTTDHSGKYTCIARNGMKPTGRGRTKLTVKAPPTTIPPTTTTTIFVPTGPASPRLYYDEKMIRQSKGREAQMKCIAVGQPRPSIHWRRHGERINTNHKYKIKDENSGRWTLESILTVRSVGFNDFGKFDCVGQNQLGLENMTLELEEIKL